MQRGRLFGRSAEPRWLTWLFVVVDQQWLGHRSRGRRLFQLRISLRAADIRRRSDEIVVEARRGAHDGKKSRLRRFAQNGRWRRSEPSFWLRRGLRLRGK